MNLSIVKNDLKRNKTINITLLVFIVLSAFLVSLGTMIPIQLFSSINNMYEIARPPHFMQMHVGDFSQADVDRFAREIDYIEAWQTVEMIDIFGNNIQVIGSDGNSYLMTDSLIDNYWVTQNKDNDILLDLNNQPLYPEQGEVAVPLILLNRYNIEIGDTIRVRDGDYNKDFKVSSFVRDSQMNSTLASSTRFLVNQEDFNQLRDNTGDIEYLIEFYFDDSSRASAFQTTYENAGMPVNGQAITLDIIRLVSGFSNIFMTVIILIASLFIILIVFLCLRFTILTVMEEEVTAIGTMKAIGMNWKDISQIYLLKYKILITAGCITGYFISLATNQIFLANINQTFGRADITFLTVLIPVLMVLAVYFLEVYFCKRIMKNIKDITVVEALVTGSKRRVTKTSKFSKLISLNSFKHLSADSFLTLKPLVLKYKSWLIIFFVMLITSAITLVPINLLNTMESPEFITYMGQSMNDIMIRIPGSTELNQQYNQVLGVLEGDNDIKDYSSEARVIYETTDLDGQPVNLHVSSSKTADDQIQYLQGDIPLEADQIALSTMNASRLGVNPGDQIKLNQNGEEFIGTVSGIYQDVTAGGFTAKMIRPYSQEQVESYSLFVNLTDNVNITEKVDQYRNQLTFNADITTMEEFVNQTLGGVASQLSRVVQVIVIIAIILAALITVLFFKLQAAKEYSQIAILKAIGFSVSDIRKQYLIKISLVAFLGIIAGTIMANTAGEYLISSFMNIMGMGITRITFIINPIMAYLIYPVLILSVIIFMTWSSSKEFKKYNIISLINE
ncbi:MAG: FtsX-like permease family protein [Bacillota bacterium]